jgi:hypothetical protein
VASDSSTTEAAKHRAIATWRRIISRALSECSTTDFHDLSDEAVDNLALVAAQAVQRELENG